MMTQELEAQVVQEEDDEVLLSPGGKTKTKKKKKVVVSTGGSSSSSKTKKKKGSSSSKEGGAGAGEGAPSPKRKSKKPSKRSSKKLIVKEEELPDFNDSKGSLIVPSDDDELEKELYPEEEEDPIKMDNLKPIPTPDNPKMDKINLILKYPNLEETTMYVDPANTNIRMIRDHLQQHYYKPHNLLPRYEQRRLVYQRKAIFDEPLPDGTDDINVLDAKTLADHGIIKDKSMIELAKMIVYVVAPTSKVPTMINNVDPMNDVIFDMKKLALQDGYPIERLRLLHKEAKYKEIHQEQNQVTFYDCGIKDGHTLILEWPIITLHIKVPKGRRGSKVPLNQKTKKKTILQDADTDDDDEFVTEEEDDYLTSDDDHLDFVTDDEIGSNDGGDKQFTYLELKLQAEMERVDKIRDYVLEETGIPIKYQKLILTPNPNAISSGGKGPKIVREPKVMTNYTKLIADYKVKDNDIIELAPLTLKLNYVGKDGGGEQQEPVETQYYPTDTIQYIKDSIANGIGNPIIPSIPSTNQSIKYNGTELLTGQQTIFEANIKDEATIDIEKERITIQIKLPPGRKKDNDGSGDGPIILDIGINPKKDDMNTIKDIISDKTGVPKAFLPKFAPFKDMALEEEEEEDASGSSNTKKLVDYNITENDVIEMKPMTIHVVNECNGEKVSISNIDPFHDTIEDIKNMISEKIDDFPTNKQRLLFLDHDLDEEDDSEHGEDDENDVEQKQQDDDVDNANDGGDGKKKKSKKSSSSSSSSSKKKKKLKKKKKKPKKKKKDNNSRKLFECNIKDLDTIQLEKSKIDITIRHPNEEDVMEMTNVDPRHDNLTKIRDFLSKEYYDGKDKDGTILSNQDEADEEEEEDDDGGVGVGGKLRPLRYNGEFMKDNTKPLRDYGFLDDGEVITMEPMIVYVMPPVPGGFEEGSQKVQPISCKVDPMNDTIQNAKLLILDNLDGIPMDKLAIVHVKVSNKKEKMINEDDANKVTFYDHHVSDYDTLIIQRKPISIQIKLPKGTQLKKTNDASDDDHDDGRVIVHACSDDDENDYPALTVKVDPDKDEFDTIRNYVRDYVGIPNLAQKLVKILVDSDPSSERKLLDDFPGKTKLSDPLLNIVDDCIIELEPMTLNIMTESGDNHLIQVLPSDTIEDVKKKLSKDVVSIPYNMQRLLNMDGKEVGGDEDYEASIGSDRSTLHELDVEDGNTFSVEKSKISLKVRMPNDDAGDEVEVFIDPKVDTADKIRLQIFDSTGLPAEYQQRLTFNDQPLDDGFQAAVLGSDGSSTESSPPKSSNKKRLVEFAGLKEGSVITIGPTPVTIMKVPENKIFSIENIDPIHDTLQDLKKKVALKTRVPPFKQRLADSETNKEFFGDKSSTETLYEYGIHHGHVILLEKIKIDIKIVLPDLQELQLTVDRRNDDLQKIRDFVFVKYYQKREVPTEDLRPMTIRGRVVDNEPGDKKLIDFGIVRDGEKIRLKVCEVFLNFPGKNEHVNKRIVVPNADPFHDNLAELQSIAKKENSNIDEMNIMFNGDIIEDFASVLYDLKINDGAELHFVRKS